MRIKTLKIGIAGVAVALFFVFSQPLLAQTDICIPQFVDRASGGLRWQTTLVLYNQMMTQAQPMLQFYNSAGQPFSGMMMNRLGPSGRRSLDSWMSGLRPLRRERSALFESQPPVLSAASHFNSEEWS